MSDSEVDKALKVCRGCYQRDIVLGYARVSGSDLRGKARKYGGMYRRSRENLFARMKAAGVQFAVILENRKLILEFGERRIFLGKNRKKLSAHPDILAALVDATDTGQNYDEVRALAELSLERQS